MNFANSTIIKNVHFAERMVAERYIVVLQKQMQDTVIRLRG